MNAAYYTYTHPTCIISSSDMTSNIAQEGKLNFYITTFLILLSQLYKYNKMTPLVQTVGKKS